MKKGIRPDKETREHIIKKMLEQYDSGKTISELASENNITSRCFYLWMQRPEFSDYSQKFNDAKLRFKAAQEEDRVEKAMIGIDKLVNGYKEEYMEITEYPDKTKTITTKVKIFPPSIVAIKYVDPLNKLSGDDNKEANGNDRKSVLKEKLDALNKRNDTNEHNNEENIVV